jgi:hypothetical protein
MSSMRAAIFRPTALRVPESDAFWWMHAAIRDRNYFNNLVA